MLYLHFPLVLTVFLLMTTTYPISDHTVFTQETNSFYKNDETTKEEDTTKGKKDDKLEAEKRREREQRTKPQKHDRVACYTPDSSLPTQCGNLRLVEFALLIAEFPL